MPLGKTETISSMAGPKSVTVYDTENVDFLNRMITESDMAINQLKRSKTLSDLDKYKAMEKLQDNKNRQVDILKKYMSDPRFREEYKNKLGILGGESPNSIIPDIGPLKETKTMSSPSVVDASNQNTFSKATTTKNKRIDKITFGSQSGNAVAGALKEHARKTLDALKEDPFIYGKQGVEEAVKRGYLSPDIAYIYENEGEDAARKAMGLGKNPLAWEDDQPKSEKNPKAKMEETIKKLESYLEDLDKEIAGEASQKNKVVELPTPKNKKSLAGVFKGLGRVAAAGLAEAPAFEFLSPPSAGPSDPEDPVYQFERGQMSSEDFAEYLKKTAGARKKTNYFDPLQTMIRGVQLRLPYVEGK